MFKTLLGLLFNAIFYQYLTMCSIYLLIYFRIHEFPTIHIPCLILWELRTNYGLEARSMTI
jgi:hypothetical protein